MATEIKLPLPAEEVETVEVVDVKVAAGAVVAAGQTLLEVEVEKSTVEVPAPMAGRITEIRVKKGDQLHVGQTFCLIEPGDAFGTNVAAASSSAPPKPKAKTKSDLPHQAPQKDSAELPGAVEGKKEKQAAVAHEGNPVPEATRLENTAAPAKPAAAPAPVTELETNEVILAGPATRQLARELGIHLKQITGTGRGNRVTREDVKSFVRQLASADTSASRGDAHTAPRLPDFSKWGPIERQPLDKVRRLTMQQMSLSWSLIPHVTQHDHADITDLETFRKQQDNGDPKLTITAFVLKAVAVVLQKFPQFNASLDQGSAELILKRYSHIGVAVDTERGLLVPVLQNVDKKSIIELARELTEIAQQAREGKAQMRGGTFTISNLGGIGGAGFTPIINYPEVAILGISRAELRGVVREGLIVPRLILPLSLSYDHRVIDGAAAARFTRHVGEMLSNPLKMLLNV